MPKEYDAIKKEYQSKHKDWSDKKVSEVAAKVFYSIYGITVKEAMKLESEHKWVSFLKSHSKKELVCDNINTCFNATTFEMKEQGDDVYVSGFVSAPIPDGAGDYVDQNQLLEKILDPTNSYATNLSYGHGWLKNDKNDSQIFGVLQKAELKEHPVYHKPAVWAEYKLMKTHPYYQKAIYELKEGALKGFSIEFKEAKRKLVHFGRTVVKKIYDYFLGGVAIVGRPMNMSATITGFAVKEYMFTEGDENMEIKEEENTQQDVNENKTTENKTNESSKQEQSNNTENNTDANINKSDNLASELESLKKELATLKSEKEAEKKRQEINEIKTELSELKAHKKVLVDDAGTEQNFKNQEPASNNTEEVNKIISDKNLNVKEKLRRMAEIDLKNEYGN